MKKKARFCERRSGRLAVKGPRKPNSGWKNMKLDQIYQCAFVTLTREESLFFRPISTESSRGENSKMALRDRQSRCG